jgi:hypothetical protein
MTYDPSPEQKKRLTEEVLGEIFFPGLVGLPFKHEGIIYSNRPFNIPKDAHDLAKKLVSEGKWGEFRHFAYNLYEIPDEYFREQNDEYSNYDSDFERWLFAEPESPARFCWLVSKWMDEK